MYQNPYRGHRKNRAKKIVLTAVLLVTTVLLLFALFMTWGLQDFIVFSADGVKFNIPALEQKVDKPSTDGDIQWEEDPSITQPSKEPTTPETPVAPQKPAITTTIQAFYLPSGKLSDTAYIDQLIRQYNDGMIGSIVIDLKLANGQLTYPTQIAAIIAVENYQASDPKVLAATVTKLRAAGVPLTGRMNAYHDPIATRAYRNSAIQLAGKITWLNERSQAHLNPDAREANQYLSDMIDEVAALGFGEIILYNFSFPSGGKQHLIDYSALSASKAEILRRNFESLQGVATAKNVTLSIEISDTLNGSSNALSGFDLALLSPYAHGVYFNVAAFTADILTPYAPNSILVPKITNREQADKNFLFMS